MSTFTDRVFKYFNGSKDQKPLCIDYTNLNHEAKLNYYEFIDCMK